MIIRELRFINYGENMTVSIGHYKYTVFKDPPSFAFYIDGKYEPMENRFDSVDQAVDGAKKHFNKTLAEYLYPDNSLGEYIFYATMIGIVFLMMVFAIITHAMGVTYGS